MTVWYILPPPSRVIHTLAQSLTSTPLPSMLKWLHALPTQVLAQGPTITWWLMNSKNIKVKRTKSFLIATPLISQIIPFFEKHSLDSLSATNFHDSSWSVLCVLFVWIMTNHDCIILSGVVCSDCCHSCTVLFCSSSSLLGCHIADSTLSLQQDLTLWLGTHVPCTCNNKRALMKKL